MICLQMLIRTEMAAITGMLTRTTCKCWHLWRYYLSNNLFRDSYRSVRNFVIDLRQMPATTSATGFHWQVSQAKSLYNIVVEMSTASGNKHQGTNLASFS